MLCFLVLKCLHIGDILKIFSNTQNLPVTVAYLKMQAVAKELVFEYFYVLVSFLAMSWLDFLYVPSKVIYLLLRERSDQMQY